MAIYVDPPIWPAHGTVFSHLISDQSLAELHAFARRADISPQAFDRDHYDVAAYRLPQLREHGALPVSAGELARKLRESGLRVPARERPEKLRPLLQRQWLRLVPRLKRAGALITQDSQHSQESQGSQDSYAGIAADLLQRWDEPGRHYHGLAHLAAVLEAITWLESARECSPEQGDLARLAAWYHDAVYRGRAGEDEQASADLACSQLSGILTDDALNQVTRLVLLTRYHRPDPTDQLGAVLCDADLEVLGRSRERYIRYTQQVRADYAHIDDDAFRTGRSRILRQLLLSRTLFNTASGQLWWETPARENIEWELEHSKRS